MIDNSLTYKNWRKKILITCYIMASLVFVMELIFFFTYNGPERNAMSADLYALRFFYGPPILIYGELVIFSLINRSSRVKEETKNLFVIFAVMIFCGIVMLSHTVYPVLNSIFIVPIFLSTIYGNKKYTTMIHYLSYLFVIGSFCISYFEFTKYGYNTNVIENYGISLVFIICSYLSSITLIEFQKMKNQDIINSYVKQQELQELLKLDSLTHLFNHSAIHEILEDLVKDKTESNANLIVAMLDIDNFKSINDTYGHTNGDIVLEVLSVLIKNNVRDKGFAARYGGEEFAIVFRDVEMKEAYQIMQRILHEFSNYYWHFMENKKITFSCGLAEVIDNDQTTKSIFDLADIALYEAKSKGKNTIVINE